MSPSVQVRPLPSSAAGELLTLQRAACVSRLGCAETLREDVHTGLRLAHLAEDLPGAQR